MLTFIDLFAGIGGFRIALEKLGCKCVFSSEIDPHARKVYLENFGHLPENNDIRQLNENDVPEHDILCAGFPCQAFSIAGRKNGFEDARGTLFFEIARIINVKRPKAILLENVQGLLNHNKGKTLRIILNILENDLEYYVPSPKILNAKDFGVPQNRPRIFIVGFRKDLNIFDFLYPTAIGKKVSLKEILEKKEVSVKYYLSEQYLQTLVKHRERHQNKGNGFGYEIISDEGIANSLVVGGMGKERNLVIDQRLTNFIPVTRIKGEVNKSKVRRMTPREWARLQGFPEDFKIVVSDVQAYKQFGNSVAIPVVQAVAEQIIKMLSLSEKNIRYLKDMQGEQLELFSKENTMYKTFNKGEWTEIYVLFYLLGTGKLYKGDSQFKIISNSFYNINKILRLENLDNIEFAIEDSESKIIISRNGKDTKILPMSDFIDKANNLIKEIRNNSNTFALPKVEDFLKSSSKNIKDIEVEIIDHDIQALEKLSFSIKSKIGSSPTIFNANLKTNFIYRIEGVNQQEVEELNQLNSAKQILKKIRSNKLIIFDAVKTNNYTEILYRNLVLVDSQMPIVVANLLLNFYSNDKSNIVDLHQKLVVDNPCQYKFDNINDIYERKIKDFLNSITLGLRASENWKTEEAPNGFLVVRQDGEIVSYHLLDRKIFEDCLFYQTKLDSPSSTRHKYGKIYMENNQFYIKLCLQVRFK